MNKKARRISPGGLNLTFKKQASSVYVIRDDCRVERHGSCIEGHRS